MRKDARKAFTWDGDVLRLGRKEVARILPEDRFPGMWRIKMPDGRLTDMVNRTRAKDAAYGLALSVMSAEAVASF